MSNRNLVTFFLACVIGIFLPQTSLSSTLEYQSAVQNSDTTEATIKQAESTNNIFLDESKIIDAIGSMNTVELETTLNFLGSTLIRELESNGFSVNEDTTMKELLNIIDPDNFIANWVAENHQETNELLNKVIKKLIDIANNADITSSFRHKLGYYNKLLDATSIPETRLPRSSANNNPNDHEDPNQDTTAVNLSYVIVGTILVAVMAIITMYICYNFCQEDTILCCSSMK